jgi:hypothetical protein
MITYNIVDKNILDGKVTELLVAEPATEGGKIEAADKLECQATGVKVKYLFRIQKDESTQMDVSAGVLKAYLIKTQDLDEKGAQKEIDRGYNVAYNAGNSTTKRITTDEKSALVEDFFA